MNSCAFTARRAVTTNLYFDSIQDPGSTCLWYAIGQSQHRACHAGVAPSHTMSLVICRTFTAVGVDVPSRAFSEKRGSYNM